MNAPDQLALFEPEGREVVDLLQRYMKQAELHARKADRFELLGLDSAAAIEDACMTEAISNAFVFAVLLDIERESEL